MRSAIILFGLIVPWSALAEDAPTMLMVQAPAHDPMNCYCRAEGRMFALGEHICLRTAEGPRLAECRMVTNVTSWGITERSCPES
jgi:hypothetical protein